MASILYTETHNSGGDCGRIRPRLIHFSRRLYLSNGNSHTSFASRSMANLLKGSSPRWLWWLALGTCLSGIFWAIEIYESGLSFFLRRPDSSATIQAVLIATSAISIFAVVTVRRANALSFGPKIRWTLLLPPLWVIWFPTLGFVGSLSPDDVKRLGQRTSQVLVAAVVASVAVFAIAWWLKVESMGTANTPGSLAVGIDKSEDFELHRSAFIQAASTLIQDGRCTEADFRNNGGWWRSTSKGVGVYFIYCGGEHVQDRLYLDTKTGRIFK